MNTIEGISTCTLVFKTHPNFFTLSHLPSGTGTIYH